MSREFFIKNENKEKICVLIEGEENTNGFAFVAHGLGGFKEIKEIENSAKALLESGYTVVTFDNRNAFGKSDGDYFNATLTSYIDDIETVIRYFETKNGAKPPFVLCGHSVGAFCSLYFAEKNPEKVKLLIPISPAVSGKDKRIKDRFSEETLKKWEEVGSKTTIKPDGRVKTLSWNYIIDGLKYDIFEEIEKIRIPTLVINGELDQTTPLDFAELFYNKLKCEKELHIIKGGPHTFHNQKHLAEIKNTIKNWMQKHEF